VLMVAPWYRRCTGVQEVYTGLINMGDGELSSSLTFVSGLASVYTGETGSKTPSQSGSRCYSFVYPLGMSRECPNKL
jgi:hypothetical protein